MIAFSSADPVFLAGVLFATAVLYAAVGNAGASGYLAVMTFAGLVVKAVGKSQKLLAHIEDVNSDGFLDLLVQIQDSDGTFNSGTTSATLTGKLFDGTSIEGTDMICVVP